VFCDLRRLIDGALYPYLDQVVWPGVATVAGLPATAAPIDKSETGLPIGVQITGPYLEIARRASPNSLNASLVASWCPHFKG
jgi:hypothetical protein